MRKIGFVTAVTLALLGTAAANAKTTVIYAGRVITDADKPAQGPSTIVITDDRITSITAGRNAAPADAAVVDLGDKTLLPGLIDLHVHLTGDPGEDFRSAAVEPDEWGVVVGVKNAGITLRAGFTTVREAGSAQYTAYSLRRGTAAGFVTGPRIIAAGPALSIIGGHGDVTGFREDVHAVLDQGYTCTGALECAEKVRKASRAGADIIKITATGGVLSQQGRGLEGHFTSPELQSIADTAHSLGLKVMAHAHGARGIEAAAAAGIDAPIIPGILPVSNVSQTRRMADMCGTAIPAWMISLFDGLDDHPAARQLVAATIAAEMCRRLYAGGVRDFHFYTLNRAELSYAICHLLGLRPVTNAKDQAA